jgi:4-alpha-glucanotransferase
MGWWRTGASDAERRNAEAYLGRSHDGIHWGFVRAAYCSPASLSIVPLQDVLGLGSEARMNTPSLHGGNWRWRFDQKHLTEEIEAKLVHLAELSDRKPTPFAPLPEENFSA